MVGVIKSKGPQEQTRAAGVLQINTAADQVASAIGRAADRVGQVAYQKFEDEQTELGRQTAKNMKMRDAAGNIVYTDPTQDMSRVARNAARPIIESNYARQLAIDFDGALIDLRRDTAAHQNNPEKFRELAQLKLEGIMNGIPQDFAGVGSAVLDQVGAERTMDHYNQLSRAKIREEEAVAISNMAIDIGEDVKNIAALIRSGDVDIAKDLAESARSKAELVIGMGGTLQQQKALTRSIDTVVYGEAANATVNAMIDEGLFDLLDPLAESFEGGRVVRPDLEVVVAGKKTTLREALAERGIDDEALANIEDVEVRGAVAASIRTRANQYSQVQSANAKMVAMLSEVNNQMTGNGLGGTGSKNEDLMQDYFSSKGLDMTNITSAEAAAMAQDPTSELGKFLRNGQVFPTGIKRQLINAANGLAPPKTADELRNLLTLWGTGSMGITTQGPVVRDKLGNDDANAFWSNVNNYAMSYGMEAATEYATALTSDSTIGADLESQARTRLGNPNKDAYAQIKQRWIDSGWKDKTNPRAMSRMKTIAIRAYASLPNDEADDYVNTAYETLFAPTDYIITPAIMGATRQDRSEFAPERFYPDDMMSTFTEHVNKKLSKAGGFYELGENAFLYPSPDSTNSSVTWQVLDRQGKPILNSNGSILIRSQELNKNNTMAKKFADAVAQKIEDAQAIRDRAMTYGNNLAETKSKGLNFGAGLIDSLLGEQ